MRILGVIAFCLISGGIYAQEAALESSRDSVLLGERVHLTVRLCHDIQTDSLTVQWPEWPVNLTPEVEVLFADTPRTQVPDAGDVFTFCHEQVLIVAVWDTGFVAIPPLTLPTTAGAYQTNALLLYSGGPTVDPARTFADAKPQVRISYTTADWLADNVWFIVLGIAVVIAAIWGYMRSKKSATTSAPTPEAEPEALPHIRAFQQLDALHQARLWQAGKVKTYHSALSDIFRTYLEGRYQIPAMEETTDEILDALRNRGLPANILTEIEPTLRMADLVKFAKHRPSDTDHNMAWDAVHRFVERTRIKSELP